MSYPEPSYNDHNAPWNLDEENNCICTKCQKERKRLAREERRIDSYD